MTLITLACVFTGMAVGLRFKVLALVPLVILAVLATLLAGQAASAWAILGAIALNAISLQVGYLCGTYAQSVLLHTHTETPALAAAKQSGPAYKTARRIRISAQ